MLKDFDNGLLLEVSFLILSIPRVRGQQYSFVFGVKTVSHTRDNIATITSTIVPHQLQDNFR
jgi:hypothetical protein